MKKTLITTVLLTSVLTGCSSSEEPVKTSEASQTTENAPTPTEEPSTPTEAPPAPTGDSTTALAELKEIKLALENNAEFKETLGKGSMGTSATYFYDIEPDADITYKTGTYQLTLAKDGITARYDSSTDTYATREEIPVAEVTPVFAEDMKTITTALQEYSDKYDALGSVDQDYSTGKFFIAEFMGDGPEIPIAITKDWPTDGNGKSRLNGKINAAWENPDTGEVAVYENSELNFYKWVPAS